MMKKISRLWKRSTETETEPQVVTSATLSEHRQKIFARGRRFVYPVYVAKHRIVFLSLFLVLVLFVVLISSFGLAIYRYKVENDLVYRVSKVIPYPVVRVDGSYGSYREYLLVLRSSQAFLNQKDEAEAQVPINEGQLGELRAQAIQEVLRRVKLKQIAREKQFEVTSSEVEDQLVVLRAVSGSETRFDDIVGEYYGLSPSELREQVRIQLLKQKAAQFLDQTATDKANEVLSKLQSGAALEELVKSYSNIEQDPLGSNAKGEATIILDDEDSYPPALLEAARNLSEGSVSGAIYSEAGIHVMRRAESTKNGTSITHIFIAYKNVNDLLDAQLLNNTVKYYLR